MTARDERRAIMECEGVDEAEILRVLAKYYDDETGELIE